MNRLEQIIMWVIFGVVIFGIALTFFIFKFSPTPTPDSSSQNGGYSGTNSSGTVTANNQSSGTQTQSQTQTLPDLTSAYVGLFGQLGVRKLEFSTVLSSANDSTGLYALYADDVAADKKLFPATTQFPIDIASVDLTNDGSPEAVVYENLAVACGTAGCPLDIYQKKGTTWTTIFSTRASEVVGISNLLVSGYLDIYLTTQGETGYQSLVAEYSWNGSTYAVKHVAAKWDGSAFTVLQ